MAIERGPLSRCVISRHRNLRDFLPFSPISRFCRTPAPRRHGSACNSHFIGEVSPKEFGKPLNALGLEDWNDRSDCVWDCVSENILGGGRTVGKPSTRTLQKSGGSRHLWIAVSFEFERSDMEIRESLGIKFDEWNFIRAFRCCERFREIELERRAAYVIHLSISIPGFRQTLLRRYCEEAGMNFWWNFPGKFFTRGKSWCKQGNGRRGIFWNSLPKFSARSAENCSVRNARV